jgi:hypothetical protein
MGGGEGGNKSIPFGETFLKTTKFHAFICVRNQNRPVVSGKN